jgi:hypothetical protein
MKKVQRAKYFSIISFIILLPFLFMTIRGIISLQREAALNLVGKTATATITGHRTNRLNDGKNVFQISYVFQKEDSSFVYNDNKGNAWAEMPYEQWRDAVNSGEVKVLYLEHNPGINHPLYINNSKFLHSAAITVLFLILSIFCGNIIVTNLHIITHHTE